MAEPKITYFYSVGPSDFYYYKRNEINLLNTRIVAYYEKEYDTIAPGKRISYFISPRKKLFPIDLNAGLSSLKTCNIPSKGIEFCLKYAMSAQEANLKYRTKVYTRTGTLVRIMETIQSKRINEVLIRVTRYNGNIYMTTEDRNEAEGVTNDNNVVTSPVQTHHNQLKRYVFADSPQGRPNVYNPSNENTEQIGIFRCDLSKYDIIYSGTVQAIMAKKQFNDFDKMDELNKCNFVLVKQMRLNYEKKGKKFLHYLYHAHLNKIKDIYVAYKNPKAIIEKPLQHNIVSKFPKHFQKKLSIAEAFLFDFLNRIELLMSNVNCLNTVYVFRIKPNINGVRYQVYEGETEKTFVTKEYKDFCKFSNNF